VGRKDTVGGKNVWRSARPAAYGGGVVESKAKRRAMGARAVQREVDGQRRVDTTAKRTAHFAGARGCTTQV
jgi:hypothetical protein